MHLGLELFIFTTFFRTVSMTHLNYIYLNQRCSANVNETGLEITCTQHILLREYSETVRHTKYFSSKW